MENIKRDDFFFPQQTCFNENLMNLQLKCVKTTRNWLNFLNTSSILNLMDPKI